MAKINSLLRILKLAHAERGLLAGATVALLITSSLGLLYPQLIRIIIDKVQPGGDTEIIDDYTIGLFVLFLVISVIAALRMYLFEIAGERIVVRLRKDLFKALTSQDISFFDQEKSGALLNRLSADTTLVQNAATVNLSMALRFSLAAIGSLIILAFTSLELTVVMLVIVPPAVIGTRLYGRWIRRLSVDVQEQLADATSIAEESISGIRTIRAFNATPRTQRRYGRGIDLAFDIAKRRARSVSTFGAIAGFLGYSTVCGVLWYGGHLYVAGDLSLGQLTSFMLYTFTVAFSIGALGTVWQSLMKASGASERVFDIIDQRPSIQSGTQIPAQSLQSLDFTDVQFSYPSRDDVEVLKGVSFELPQGKQLAIVGPSGAGKSTVASLIARLYDPSAGQISVDNVPIENLDLIWWRDQIGVVFQEPILFAYSIRENLLLGNESASDDTLWSALEAARLADFVRALPDGLNTQTGERGVQLSGGQRQRMAIARLIVKDPPLVILDEATSALDSATETEIKTALNSLLSNRTALMIAHRLSTVIDADEILYMEDGMIADRGAHDYLMQSSTRYAHLVEGQLLRDRG